MNATLTVVNFSHPVTPEQRAAIAQQAGYQEVEVLEPPNQLDLHGDVVEQVRAMVDAVPLSAEDWQGTPLVVVLPGLALSAAVALAELNGRMGHFPTVVRMARGQGPVAAYEVLGLLDLQGVRDDARTRRR